MKSDTKYFVPDDEKGGYRYIGKYYRFCATGGRLANRKRGFFLCALLALVTFLLAGFSDAGETRAFYIGLPFVISLIPTGFGLAAAFDTLRAEESMTYLRYRSGPKRLILCARVGAVLTLITLVGCAYHGVRGGMVMPYFPLYISLMFLAFAAQWVIYVRDPAQPVGS